MSLKTLKDNLLVNNNFHKAYFNKTNIVFEIAEMVTNERMNKGLTQKDLAKLLKTKQSSISRLESGNSLPSLNFLEKIAKALNMKLLAPRFISIEESKTLSAAREANDLKSFQIAGSRDVLNQLGPISKKEYDYYENV